jgi:hypothetical protein
MIEKSDMEENVWITISLTLTIILVVAIMLHRQEATMLILSRTMLISMISRMPMAIMGEIFHHKAICHFIRLPKALLRLLFH